MVKQEEATGHIPLPAVDSIRRDSDRAPVVVLVDPNAIPGAIHVFVRTEEMTPADRMAFYSLLQMLERVLGSTTPIRSLTAVSHPGGLDYSFCGSLPGEVVELRDLPESLRPLLWGLLHAIASLGVRYPDIEASTPRIVERSK
ncbi:MAG: hypothetical protein HY690_08045 [Chloroflexi bacterium]|nr:hypothetical protein [Chloroflexota bacterium]